MVRTGQGLSFNSVPLARAVKLCGGIHLGSNFFESFSTKL